MSPLTSTERRTLSLAVGLLVLATAVRLALAPGPGDFGWVPAPTARPAESVGAAIRAVGDTLASVAEAARPLAPGEKIDVNRASAVQLQRLPGIGPARAAAIIRERTTGGAFSSPADLTRVPGVGPVVVARWADAIRISTTPGTRVASRSPRIDLNRAHPKELEQITGIGPALARRIVDARGRRGRFSSMEDLLEIKGIGPKTMDIVREQAFVR